jgi:hypothetical protein
VVLIVIIICGIDCQKKKNQILGCDHCMHASTRNRALSYLRNWLPDKKQPLGYGVVGEPLHKLSTGVTASSFLLFSGNLTVSCEARSSSSQIQAGTTQFSIVTMIDLSSEEPPPRAPNGRSPRACWPSFHYRPADATASLC